MQMSEMKEEDEARRERKERLQADIEELGRRWQSQTQKRAKRKLRSVI